MQRNTWLAFYIVSFLFLTPSCQENQKRKDLVLLLHLLASKLLLGHLLLCGQFLLSTWDDLFTLGEDELNVARRAKVSCRSKDKRFVNKRNKGIIQYSGKKNSQIGNKETHTNKWISHATTPHKSCVGATRHEFHQTYKFQNKNHPWPRADLRPMRPWARYVRRRMCGARLTWMCSTASESTSMPCTQRMTDPPQHKCKNGIICAKHSLLPCNTPTSNRLY